jgi:hypothetical protein
MNVKKYSVLAVLALLVLSMVPLAFAEDNDSRQLGRDAMRDRFRNAAERMHEARERAMNARAHIAEVHTDFLKARERIHSKDATPADKQEFLLATADRILSLLGKLYERVNGSDIENKTATLDEIQNAMDEVTDARAKIETLAPGNVTRQDVHDAAEAMRQAWHDALMVLRKGATHVIEKRVGLVVQQMEHLSAKLERILAHLNEKGYDVSDADALKAQFDAKLASAKDHWQKAKDLFDAGKIPESNAEIRLAHDDLKAAHDILKELVTSIRGKAKPADFEDSENETPENETED